MVPPPVGCLHIGNRRMASDWATKDLEPEPVAQELGVRDHSSNPQEGYPLSTHRERRLTTFHPSQTGAGV